jgi:hypothetical protein
MNSCNCFVSSFCNMRIFSLKINLFSYLVIKKCNKKEKML